MEGHAFYQKLDRFSLFYDYFAFLDVEMYAADQLCIQHQVTVHFVREYHPAFIFDRELFKSDLFRFLITGLLEQSP